MGDNYCDAINNRAFCNYDGGDCCASTVKTKKVGQGTPSAATPAGVSNLLAQDHPWVLNNPLSWVCQHSPTGFTVFYCIVFLILLFSGGGGLVLSRV